MFVCKIDTFARARTRPISTRATIGYLVYNMYVCNYSPHNIVKRSDVMSMSGLITPLKAVSQKQKVHSRFYLIILMKMLRILTVF